MSQSEVDFSKPEISLVLDTHIIQSPANSELVRSTIDSLSKRIGIVIPGAQALEMLGHANKNSYSIIRDGVLKFEGHVDSFVFPPGETLLGHLLRDFLNLSQNYETMEVFKNLITLIISEEKLESLFLIDAVQIARDTVTEIGEVWFERLSNIFATMGANFPDDFGENWPSKLPQCELRKFLDWVDSSQFAEQIILAKLGWDTRKLENHPKKEGLLNLVSGYEKGLRGYFKHIIETGRAFKNNDIHDIDMAVYLWDQSVIIVSNDNNFRKALKKGGISSGQIVSLDGFINRAKMGLI